MDSIPGEAKFREQTPTITDDSVKEARKLIGVWLDHHQKALTITTDLIRQWAHSYGDENPIFCDESYARNTRWKGLIAPPGFLVNVHSTQIGPGLRGIQWIYGGTEWHFFLPVRPGDTITARARLVDAVEKRGEHVPRLIIQTGEVIYRNQRDEVVARAVSLMDRVPRARSGGSKKYESRLYKYSTEELKAIEKACEGELRRGPAPLLWQDIGVDSEIPPIVKGPLRVVEISMSGNFSAGEGEINSLQGAHVYQVLHRRRHPADTYYDSETGIQDHPHRGHWEKFMSEEVSMPGMYDIGRQRICWTAQMLTNWMGDSGFVRYLKVVLRRPNVVNDTSWCRGRITGKRIDDGRRLVSIQTRVENQLGEITAPGEAIVELL